MNDIYLEVDGKIEGPFSATDLKKRKVPAHARIRRSEEREWNRFANALWNDEDVRSTLEEAIDPEEQPDEQWRKRGLGGFALASLPLLGSILWIVADALGQRSYAAWACAAVFVLAAFTSLGGVLSRRPWGWYLSTLLSVALTLRVITLTLAAPNWSLLGLLCAHCLATGALFVWTPRGAAVSWPHRLRRLLLLYSADAATETRKLRQIKLDIGPASAFFGGFLFFSLGLALVSLYHWWRFPLNDFAVSIVPRGDGWGRIVSILIYLSMVVISIVLGKRNWRQIPQHLTFENVLRAARFGSFFFLSLAVVLISGRWAMRAIEVILSAVDRGAFLFELRGAIGDIVIRDTSEATFSVTHALWFYVITLVVGPLCEEVFFRGLIFAALRQRWPFWPAALASASFFAALHLLGPGFGNAAPLLAFEITLGGVIAAKAYEASGSLLAPIAMHILWNTYHEASTLLPYS